MYTESAIEDDDIAERIDTGRSILEKNSKEWGHEKDELSGPCHPTLEKGTGHFMEWWKGEDV